jgi:hypothetical protein
MLNKYERICHGKNCTKRVADIRRPRTGFHWVNHEWSMCGECFVNHPLGSDYTMYNRKVIRKSDVPPKNRGDFMLRIDNLHKCYKVKLEEKDAKIHELERTIRNLEWKHKNYAKSEVSA